MAGVLVKTFLDDHSDDAHDKRDIVGALQCLALQGRPHIFHPFGHQPQGNHNQDDADKECRQGLILAPAIAVPLINTLARQPHHGIDQRIGHRVADTVDTIGENGTGVAQKTRHDLKCRQAHVARHAYQRAPLLLSVALVVIIVLLVSHR